MTALHSLRSKILVLLLAISSLISGCTSAANSRYFGKTVAPTDNVLRYVTGSEPETLDPQLPDTQPEARIFLALYDGLVEYDPKDMQPIPAIAKSWEISPKVDEFIFHLRDTAKWSDGTSITARDFVYSLRRGFAPETISRTANLGNVIKYAEAFNGGQVFVKKGGRFVVISDIDGSPAKSEKSFGPETEFNKFLHSPERLALEGDEKKRAKQIDADPKLKAAVDGAEFVPVKGEDIGVEAIDDFTLRLTLRQPAPYLIGLLPHQFFRLVPQKAIEAYGKNWTKPEHIVTCGAFRVKSVRPYDALVLEKDPNYWDAANVHLAGIEFYPLEENATMLNLYKSGAVDAFPNHTVLASWIDEVRGYKDEYMNFPEFATAYYAMNNTKPPFNDPKVRQAFSYSIDREALASFRKTVKPLYDLSPSGIVPEYDKARGKVSEDIRWERGVAPDAWKRLVGFDPEFARKLLGDAGFPVQKSGDSYSCPNFPTDKVFIDFQYE